MLFLEAKVQGRTVRWPLSDGHYVLGRGDGADIVIDDSSVSREHLELVVEAGAARIRDLGSTNGVWLSGERIDSAQLELNEWFALGAVLVSVRHGISMASLDESAFFRSERRARGAADRHTVSESTGDGGLRVVGGVDAGIAAICRRARESAGEARVQAILDELQRRHELTSAAFLSEVGDAWCVVGHRGSPIPEEFEETLASVSGESAVRVDGKGDLGGLVVPCRHADGRGCLVLHPWEVEAGLPAEIEVALSLLVTAEPAPVDAAGVAPTQPIRPPRQRAQTEEYVAVSQLSLKVLQEIDRLAQTDLPVLLHGESGTGKDLLARRLHDGSERGAGPFVAINCAAIPAELLEAELFGIEEGVATGVTARAGRFEQASGGTLFLDEIGDLPSTLQPKLLRALESGEISPLGSRSALRVDVRLVSASHRDLRESIEDGSFRQDLRYRIAGAIVHVPPLRDRPDEVLPLARSFARSMAASRGITFGGIDLDAARALLGYAWPGNVRELRHVVARAVALADGPILHAELLPAEVREGTDGDRGEFLLGLRDDFRTARERFERMYFAGLVERCGGNLTDAARKAGMSRSSLYRKLEEHGLR